MSFFMRELSFFNTSSPSPIQEIQSPLLKERKLRLLVKRDDLLDKSLSGNKWRKLKYNLHEAFNQQKKCLLTFGGAYSNHLYATAAAGQRFGIPTIGIVRGEAVEPPNPTIRFLRACQMKLHFVSRHAYRQKTDLLDQLDLDLTDCYILPEGGSNPLAMKGCTELVEETREQLAFVPEVWALACGTGATLAGLIEGLGGTAQALGIAVLRDASLGERIQSLLSRPLTDNWSLCLDYHFGGYARFDEELIQWINDFRRQFGIPLEPLYTGKLFFGLFDLIQQGYFPVGTTILAVHTGGLQGIIGFNERFGPLIEN
ncbi:MAG: pyridoxal-phosphate dependent enzyme [Bacteroidota bacterium]